MKELKADDDIYWIRENDAGVITAALVEKAFDPLELADELADMRRVPGTIRRVIASRVVLGERLKQAAKAR